MKLGTGGKVDVFNQAGSVNIIADVLGFYSADNTPLQYGGQYHAIKPVRALDTRRSSDGPAMPPGWTYGVGLQFGAGNSHVVAYAAHITAVAPQAAGYFSAYDGISSQTAASTLNFTKGKTVSNMTIVPAVACGNVYNGCNDSSLPMISVANNSSGSTHLIVDIVGYYDDTYYASGSRFTAITPKRIVDTRSGLGTTPIGSNAVHTVTTPNTLVDTNSTSLLINLTAIRPTKSTFLSVWANDGSSKPYTSNLNPVAGQVIANAAFTGLGNGGQFNIYNYVGTTNVVVDVNGVFELYPYNNPNFFGITASTAIPRVPALDTFGAATIGKKSNGK
jgi:hypothetical protein